MPPVYFCISHLNGSLYANRRIKKLKIGLNHKHAMTHWIWSMVINSEIKGQWILVDKDGTKLSQFEELYQFTEISIYCWRIVSDDAFVSSQHLILNHKKYITSCKSNRMWQLCSIEFISNFLFKIEKQHIETISVRNHR